MTDLIQAFSDYLVNTKNASKNTLDSYRRDLSKFLKYLDENEVGAPSCNKECIQTYLDVLKKQGKTNATLVRVLASIRCFYQFLIFDGQCDQNPTKNIVLEKVEKKLPEILSQREVDALLAQPDITTLRGCRDKAMLELLYATGVRVSELIDLNLDNVNLQVNLLHCTSEKNDRIIPIYKSAVKAVEDYLVRVRPVLVSNRSEKALFLNMNGERLTRQGFWKIIKGYAQSAGIEKSITPHTMRHSFAAHLLENGAGIKDIKDMLGHSGISSTQVYAQIIKQKYDASYKKFHPKAGQ